MVAPQSGCKRGLCWQLVAASRRSSRRRPSPAVGGRAPGERRTERREREVVCSHLTPDDAETAEAEADGGGRQRDRGGEGVLRPQGEEQHADEQERRQWTRKGAYRLDRSKPLAVVRPQGNGAHQSRHKQSQEQKAGARSAGSGYPRELSGAPRGRHKKGKSERDEP